MQPGAGHDRADGLAAIQGGEAAAELAVEFGQSGGAGGIVFFQEPERFAHDFTRRVVAARGDLRSVRTYAVRRRKAVTPARPMTKRARLAGSGAEAGSA